LTIQDWGVRFGVYSVGRRLHTPHRRRFLVFGFWFLVIGLWFLVSGFWFLVLGFWFLVFGGYSRFLKCLRFDVWELGYWA
jgi:hypothetical protein